MLKAMRSRLNKDEGFTLIELMVVVLIIAILVAIAIPTFLGQRKNAQDSAAKSNLRNALATEKAFFSVNQVFTQDAVDLGDIEPNLFDTGSDPVTAVIGDAGASADADEGGTVCLSQQSASGTWYALWDGTTEGTVYYTHATTAPLAADCAKDTQPLAAAGWVPGGW